MSRQFLIVIRREACQGCRMKTLICLLSFWSYVLMADVAEPVVEAAEPHELDGSRWLLEDIENTGVIDNARSTLHFDGNGRISGSGGCNRISGGVILDGTEIKFGPVMSTRMACPVPALMDQEQRYLMALAEARSFVLEADGAILQLLNEDGHKILRFSRIVNL